MILCKIQLRRGVAHPSEMRHAISLGSNKELNDLRKFYDSALFASIKYELEYQYIFLPSECHEKRPPNNLRVKFLIHRRKCE